LEEQGVGGSIPPRGTTGVEFYPHKLLAYKICSIINLWKFTVVKTGFALSLSLSLSLSRKREEIFSPIYLLPLQVSVAEFFCIVTPKVDTYKLLINQ